VVARFEQSADRNAADRMALLHDAHETKPGQARPERCVIWRHGPEAHAPRVRHHRHLPRMW
jgi:hypothetical protein